MRSKLVILGLLLLFTSLVGCGGAEPKPTGAVAPSKEQEKQKLADDAQTWKKMTKNDSNNP
ncbi:MAG TPA: hypothetical protein VGE74_21280 [Gemmata sp.]